MTLRYPVPERLWRCLFTTGLVVDFVAPYDSSDVRGWILEQCYPGKNDHKIAGITEVPVGQLELTSADNPTEVDPGGLL